MVVRAVSPQAANMHRRCKGPKPRGHAPRLDTKNMAPRTGAQVQSWGYIFIK